MSRRRDGATRARASLLQATPSPERPLIGIRLGRQPTATLWVRALLKGRPIPSPATSRQPRPVAQECFSLFNVSAPPENCPLPPRASHVSCSGTSGGVLRDAAFARRRVDESPF